MFEQSLYVFRQDDWISVRTVERESEVSHNEHYDSLEHSTLVQDVPSAMGVMCPNQCSASNCRMRGSQLLEPLALALLMSYVPERAVRDVPALRYFMRTDSISY